MRTQSFLRSLEKVQLPGPLCQRGLFRIKTRIRIKTEAEVLHAGHCTLHREKGLSTLILKDNQAHVFVASPNIPQRRGKNEALLWWAGCLSSLLSVYLCKFIGVWNPLIRPRVNCVLATGQAYSSEQNQHVLELPLWEHPTAKLKRGCATQQKTEGILGVDRST